ncbi:hypothetical protein D1007_29650 [Hordeum vulgare]|nr:hypothetical protein D1007_29650 [Hordeum vulgare]
MLKDIAKSPEVDVIVKSAKTICKFMHKHNNLHDNMKKNIGGELIRPNATRFGTVFMFPDSYHSKKDKFREWMVSKDWKECQWRYEPGYVFAEECLSSNVWWNALEWVLGSLRPLYMAMRLYLTFMRKVGKRIDAMEEDTFMVAAVVLDPYTHYKLNLCNHTDYATSLTDAIAKILDPVSALSTIDEVRKFRECQGSGCERNWSAFALVHTKQRNRLLYDKLDKLVSVRYNLKIRAEEDEGKERDIDKEIDPSALLMDTTMFDETNPIMEWLNEDVEDPIMHGADAASAVFEKIRHLNSRRKGSYVGSKGSNKKRKRSDDDENEFVETESEDDDGENKYVDNDIEDDDAVSEDDEDGLQDQLETQMQLEEETQVQVEKDTTSIGNLETRRSGRRSRKRPGTSTASTRRFVGGDVCIHRDECTGSQAVLPLHGELWVWNNGSSARHLRLCGSANGGSGVLVTRSVVASAAADAQDLVSSFLHVWHVGPCFLGPPALDKK